MVAMLFLLVAGLVVTVPLFASMLITHVVAMAILVAVVGFRQGALGGGRRYWLDGWLRDVGGRSHWLARGRLCG